MTRALADPSRDAVARRGSTSPPGPPRSTQQRLARAVARAHAQAQPTCSGTPLAPSLTRQQHGRSGSAPAGPDPDGIEQQTGLAAGRRAVRSQQTSRREAATARSLGRGPALGVADGELPVKTGETVRGRRGTAPTPDSWQEGRGEQTTWRPDLGAADAGVAGAWRSGRRRPRAHAGTTAVTRVMLARWTARDLAM